MDRKTRIALGIVIVSNALGNVVLGHGMRSVGDISSYSPVELASSAIRSLASPWVLLGVLLLLLFFVVHTLILSWADLSYVLLVTSVGYVLVAAASRLLLDEPITAQRWIGIVLVAGGVAFAASTPVSTAGSDP